MERFDSQQLLDLELLDAGDDNLLDMGLLEELFDNEMAGLIAPPEQPQATPFGAPPAFDLLQQQQAAVPVFHGINPVAPSFVPAAMLQAQPFENAGFQQDMGSGMSGEHSGETTSSGQDVQGAGRMSANGGRGRRTSTATAGAGSDQNGKKKRTRNAQQMELNRIAQQKYRERKKMEHSELQTAVDQLATQLAAFKVLEVRANQLEAHNAALQNSLTQQNATIDTLKQQVSSQAEALSSTRAELAQSQDMVARQQQIILDQHAKIELQNQVIDSLKDQLRSKIDEAMDCATPGSVCEKLVAAVKAAIYGARNMEELQDQLDRIPPALVTEICKNIFCVIKEMFPELKARCNALVAANNVTSCMPCC